MYTVALFLTVTLSLLPLSRASECSLCGAIKSTLSNSPTGYYTVVSDDGLVHQVYCNMGTLCGSDGSWTRVAYLDMSDIARQCPDARRLYEQDGVRACGRPAGGASCPSLRFTTSGNYIEVCGRVIGYQYGYAGGINPYGHGSTYKLDQTYVDGISLTRESPHQHIWTFITTHNEECDGLSSDNRHSYPCVMPDSVASLLPSFLGDDWFCESGSSGTTVGGVFYNSDRLWDGEQCGSHEPCCNTTGQPWFHKTLDSHHLLMLCACLKVL